ncbi:hypothetical protein ABAZ39_18575 (plasmid) [Azospirillum argentinense]|uniref:Uncharacterized protein n=1 Tax=Azospirillum argentinense TaxID=2970906 RepID=A0A060DM47_9PROT|nr:hypothetical protein [Azospirillum argentinense]AIB13942.1 hypothetical protein ABAZ39_18575 [Azospirillum argentinense]EZQ06504.1 hypothetical protein ABAZ39_19525 [Azospirillum argentinense]
MNVRSAALLYVCFRDLADRHGALDAYTPSSWLHGHTDPPLADLADVFGLLSLRLRLTPRRACRVAPAPGYRLRAGADRRAPLVRDLFMWMDQRQATAKDLAAAGGPPTTTLAKWKVRSTPRLDAFERAAAPLGLALDAVEDDSDTAATPALSAYRAGLTA